VTKHATPASPENVTKRFMARTSANVRSNVNAMEAVNAGLTLPV
jgi:hypothetical protein